MIFSVILSLFLSNLIVKWFTNFHKNNECLTEVKNILAIHYPDILDKVVIIGDDKSFTINKKFVHLCVKDDNGKCYDVNTLLYVVLHEFAHVISKSVGKNDEHNDEFYKNFNKLLKQAEEKGIYDPKKPIKNYCHY